MNRLDVFYQGLRVGTLALPPGKGIYFEYAPEFLASGFDLSPLRLPLQSGAHSRYQPATVALPGLFEDSLPDSWGSRIMSDWFKARGVSEFAITPLMKLAYIGERGFGALSYAPAEMIESSDVSLAELYTAASSVVSGAPVDLVKLAAVGSSAGGAQPKAAVWMSGSTGAITATPEGPEAQAWLVKFDATPGRWFGRMEYAYSLLCRAAGCEFPDTRLLRTEHQEGERWHFAVRRFDRVGTRRVHYHSLAAMYHLMAGDLDYQTLLRVTRRITADYREVLQAFRRAVFNVLASNRDDHGKNHGFLYENRHWRMSPAFDVTYLSPEQMAERGMAVMGERHRVGLAQLQVLAQGEGIEKKDVRMVLEEVATALQRWPEFAEQAGVPEAIAASIQRGFRPVL